MELSKSENQLQKVEVGISGLDAIAEAKIATWVSAMCGSLKTYGKSFNASMAQGWLMAMRSAKDVSLTEFESAAYRWIAEETEFPTPAEFFESIRDRRVNENLRADCDRTAEVAALEDEEKRLAWRARRLGDALDVSMTDIRAAVQDFLAETPPDRRMPEVRELKNFDESRVSPEQQARIEEQIKRMRRNP